MTRKPSKRAKNDLENLPPMTLGAMRSPEQAMDDLQRLLLQQDFESEAEVNAFMENLMAGGGFIPQFIPETPLEKAQELMYEAMETQNRGKRVKLARKALELSPDCADAYVLLADDTAKTPQEALKLYEQAVEAGKRAIGEDFEEMKGNFWGLIETRPYMRARLALAHVLFMLGEIEKAIEHLEALIELNPDDNQGIRYILLSVLVSRNDHKRTETLLKQYKNDGSASWKYSAALHEFRKNGRSKRAAKLLSDAISYNPHVPLFLLNRKKLPRANSPYYSPGDESEAIEYLSHGLTAWIQTEGAIDWVREVNAGL